MSRNKINRPNPQTSNHQNIGRTHAKKKNKGKENNPKIVPQTYQKLKKQLFTFLYFIHTNIDNK